MANFFAWLLFALGIAHIAFAVVKFKAPLFDALAAGFIGQFKAPEIRRTAFWFFIFGPVMMLAGHAAVHAVAVGDHALLRIIGTYATVTSLIGIAALPKSPFLVALPISAAILACGYGWLG